MPISGFGFGRFSPRKSSSRTHKKASFRSGVNCSKDLPLLEAKRNDSMGVAKPEDAAGTKPMKFEPILGENGEKLCEHGMTKFTSGVEAAAYLIMIKDGQNKVPNDIRMIDFIPKLYIIKIGDEIIYQDGKNKNIDKALEK
ncbi:MAG: hypothetical protein HRT90_12225, partial [Candidatus Margulisbacteria bacterium]|nr:hypothetical protein [Candidatus Margulisiibacteriota bacterium]